MHWRIDLLSVLLLLNISMPHLVQADLSMRVANSTHAWTHTYKIGGYSYFRRLAVTAILNIFVQ